MAALCAAMFMACSDDDKDPLNEEGGEGVITMIYEGNQCNDNVYVRSFKEGDIITFDWGDGTIEEFKTVYYDAGDNDGYHIDDPLEHEYGNSNSHIITIKGNIKRLSCWGDGIFSLDISKCPALTDLRCEATNVSFLDVSKCTALTDLYCCQNNNLTSLDVSKNTKLTVLTCWMNNLTSLDVSKNTALTELHCYDNNLTSLDVSKCAALTYLNCWNNNLTFLDVSKNTKLTKLWCGGNNLTSLDVSKNTALTYLSCSYSNLTSLDISKNTELTDLRCRNNNFSAEALNKIFTDLPIVKQRAPIYIGDNPGTATCDKSIAEKKGWYVDEYGYGY